MWRHTYLSFDPAFGLVTGLLGGGKREMRNDGVERMVRTPFFRWNKTKQYDRANYGLHRILLLFGVLLGMGLRKLESLNRFGLTPY